MGCAGKREAPCTTWKLFTFCCMPVSCAYPFTSHSFRFIAIVSAGERERARARSRSRSHNPLDRDRLSPRCLHTRCWTRGLVRSVRYGRGETETGIPPPPAASPATSSGLLAKCRIPAFSPQRRGIHSASRLIRIPAYSTARIS